jgi:hypothetical protein
MNLVSVIETVNCVSFFVVVFWEFDDVLEFRYRMQCGICLQLGFLELNGFW